MERLTTAQRELYDYLLERQRSGGPMASYREMMQAMELKSPAPVQARLKQLKNKGYLLQGGGGKYRNIRVYDPMTAVYVPGKYAQQVREYVGLLQSPQDEDVELEEVM
jgi:SOS-response transcriptional repressor LexA